MTSKKLTYSLTAAAAALLMFQPLFAADENTAVVADAAPASSGIPLYSGGVGEEMDYIKSVEHEYDLKLLFTEANGTFLADLPVSIRDKKGDTIVSTVTKGPILLVNLPAGTYNVTATDGNISREQKLTLSSNSLRTYQIRFPTHQDEIP